VSPFSTARWSASTPAAAPIFAHSLYRRAEPYFYAFDLLWHDGDLRDRPLIERKRLLRKLILLGGSVRYLDHVLGRGTDLFAAVCASDLEGIVAKERHGRYAPDVTTCWKVKNARYSQARDRHELFERSRTRAAR
jgi:ATP-dependent DNA ligase